TRCARLGACDSDCRSGNRRPGLVGDGADERPIEHLGGEHGGTSAESQQQEGNADRKRAHTRQWEPPKLWRGALHGGSSFSVNNGAESGMRGAPENSAYGMETKQELSRSSDRPTQP